MISIDLRQFSLQILISVYYQNNLIFPKEISKYILLYIE